MKSEKRDELLRMDVFTYASKARRWNYRGLPYLRWSEEYKGFFRVIFDGEHIIVGFEAYNTDEDTKEISRAIKVKPAPKVFRPVDDEYDIEGAIKLTNKIMKAWSLCPDDKPPKEYSPNLYYGLFQGIVKNDGHYDRGVYSEIDHEYVPYSSSKTTVRSVCFTEDYKRLHYTHTYVGKLQNEDYYDIAGEDSKSKIQNAIAWIRTKSIKGLIKDE